LSDFIAFSNALVQCPCGPELIDKTARNVQFEGAKPVFLDHGALSPYKNGELWIGHKQFLPPLLWMSKIVRPFNDWYGGTFEGIPDRVLPMMSRPLSLKLFMQVLLSAYLEGRDVHSNSALETAAKANGKLAREASKGLLHALAKWAGFLEIGVSYAVCENYSNDTSYRRKEASKKPL